MYLQQKLIAVLSSSALSLSLVFAIPLFAQSTPPAQQQQQQQQQQQPQQISAEALFALVLANAEKGDTQAMINLGSMYEQGLGVARNYTKALEWYQKAAQSAAEPEAYLRVGLCFEVGMGAVADMKRAVANFERASSLGSAQADYKLASLYIQGRGVKKDDKKGFELLKKAANSDGTAANELAVVYLRGMLGQTEDMKLARQWFTKSAEAGNLEGMKNLAVMLKDGMGQKADPAAALRWYITAQRGGLRASDMDSVIDGLKKQLKPDQIKRAEEEADKWVAAFVDRARNNR